MTQLTNLGDQILEMFTLNMRLRISSPKARLPN